MNDVLAHEIACFVVQGGASKLQEGAVLGMGAIIAPHRTIGRWSTVLINSAVVSDMPDGVSCGGVPAVVFGKATTSRVA